MRKIFSSITAFTIFASISINNYPITFKTDAASYRTSYKIYGDLNNDKAINSFDVISMRKAIISGDTTQDLDFNRDDKVDSADLTLLSDYVLGKNIFFDAYLYDDADEDSVCDMLEISILESDPDSKDTDGDTLSDFDEVVYTNTSPTNQNTRGLSVTDAKDDADGDKLTNKEEIAANTNPQIADSDMDGINDYEELKKYNTDPNNEDTDNDGIIDGDEIKLGLKPDSDQSDGQTPDNQRTFENKISSSNNLLTHINTEDTPYEVSIDIKSAGNIEKALSVQNGSFSNISENKYYIGNSVAFSYDEKLAVDTAKIYFKPKSVDGSIENYMIFEFFPETNYLLPVETKYTSDSAYVETNELGTFILINTDYTNQSVQPVKKSLFEQIKLLASEKEIHSNDIVQDYELGALEVAFFVDASKCLDDNIEETKKSIHDCCQAIFEHSNDAYVEIIGYYGSPDCNKSDFYFFTNSDGAPIHNNIFSVDDTLENMSPFTDDDQNSLNSVIENIEAYSDDLFSSDGSQKYAFVILNSDYSFTNRSQYKFAIPPIIRNDLKEIYNSNIHLNFLISQHCYNQKTALRNFQEVCEPYKFGIYTHSETGYFGNSGFARLYCDAITDIYKESICYVSTLTSQSIPKEVNRNAFLNSLPSSYDKSKVPAADANGNINFKDAAVKIGAANYDKNGNLVFPSMLNVCSYNELTRIGYEQYMKNRSTSERLIAGSIQITPFSDKILYEDNDGDGIPNVNDPYPNKAFDERFEIIDDYYNIPTINWVENHIKVGEECLYSKFPNPADAANKLLFSGLCDVGAGSPALEGWLKLTGSEFVGKFDFSSSIQFAKFISWYLFANGKTLYLSKDNMYQIIMESKHNREHYAYNINQMKKAVEEIITSNNTYSNPISISAKSNAIFKGTCYKGNYCQKKKENEIYYSESGIFYDDATALDWGYAIGESLCTMSSKAFMKNGEYYMYFRYYIIDNYEYAYHWEEEEGNIAFFDKAGHRLHETGTGREFKIIGVYNDVVKWKQGETLYSNDYVDIKLDEEKYNAGPYR